MPIDQMVFLDRGANRLSLIAYHSQSYVISDPQVQLA